MSGLFSMDHGPVGPVGPLTADQEMALRAPTGYGFTPSYIHDEANKRGISYMDARRLAASGQLGPAQAITEAPAFGPWSFQRTIWAPPPQAAPIATAAPAPAAAPAPGPVGTLGLAPAPAPAPVAAPATLLGESSGSQVATDAQTGSKRRRRSGSRGRVSTLLGDGESTPEYLGG